MSDTVLLVQEVGPFAEDQAFEQIRQILHDEGVEWPDSVNIKGNQNLFEENQATDFVFPVMDNLFFHQDRFEILIDARGFRPEDIKCTMTQSILEVVGQRVENVSNACRSMSLARTYQFPQPVIPEEGTCCFSSEGILSITAPWYK
ncbi:hypothetical protein NQ317_003788 [Molorchus minor]|uniref:SHSP domain-containing protein n=1 Tax=Molorchus minor TaxID=1323400 RepID=A0ABQ9JTV0_9CUCU|nr:hypothetical protein NQ317_003788 [Molorchus minor]